MSELSVLGFIFILIALALRYRARPTWPKAMAAFSVWAFNCWGFGLIALDMGNQIVGKTILALGMLSALACWVLYRAKRLASVLSILPQYLCSPTLTVNP